MQLLPQMHFAHLTLTLTAITCALCTAKAIKQLKKYTHPILRCLWNVCDTAVQVSMTQSPVPVLNPTCVA